MLCFSRRTLQWSTCCWEYSSCNYCLRWYVFCYCVLSQKSNLHSSFLVECQSECTQSKYLPSTPIASLLFAKEPIEWSLLWNSNGFLQHGPLSNRGRLPVSQVSRHLRYLVRVSSVCQYQYQTIRKLYNMPCNPSIRHRRRKASNSTTAQVLRWRSFLELLCLSNKSFGSQSVRYSCPCAYFL